MIGSTRNVRVWAAPQPTDLRKGYDGLYGLVSGALGRDPQSGDLFLFVNRSRRSCKARDSASSASGWRRDSSRSCGATTVRFS